MTKSSRKKRPWLEGEGTKWRMCVKTGFYIIGYLWQCGVGLVWSGTHCKTNI